MHQEYKVKEAFVDKHTQKLHQVDSTFSTADGARAKELLELGFLHIATVEEELDERLEHVGGGYFKLPNGDKVRGKDAAAEALKKLDETPNEEV